MDVDTPAYHATFGPDEEPTWGLCDKRVDGIGQLLHERRVEQVQRGAIDAEDSEGTIVVDADEAHGWGSVGWKETNGGEPT